MGAPPANPPIIRIESKVSNIASSYLVSNQYQSSIKVWQKVILANSRDMNHYVGSMDKVHSATRPVWAISGAESAYGMILSLTVVLMGFLLGWLHEVYLPQRRFSELEADLIIGVFSTILFFIICSGGLHIYGWLQRHRYPGSYIYCFERKDTHTGSLKKVLGYFILNSRNDGSMIAAGASFDWNGSSVDESTRVGWHSVHVGSTVVESEPICFILYDVDLNEGTQDLRPYSHGLLQFKRKTGDFGIVSHEEAYVGTMQAIDPPTTRITVYNKAYSERIGKRMSSEDLEFKLNRYGRKLIVCYEGSLDEVRQAGAVRSVAGYDGSGAQPGVL